MTQGKEADKKCSRCGYVIKGAVLPVLKPTSVTITAPVVLPIKVIQGERTKIRVYNARYIEVGEDEGEDEEEKPYYSLKELRIFRSASKEGPYSCIKTIDYDDCLDDDEVIHKEFKNEIKVFYNKSLNIRAHGTKWVTFTFSKKGTKQRGLYLRNSGLDYYYEYSCTISTK